MQSFQVNTEDDLFQKSKQVTPFHPGKGKYKPAMKATSVKSEPATSKRTRGKAQLRFSRLGFRLFHWLWAHHIQLSAQIFHPDCRPFCLFQDFSPFKKVLHPEHPPCKPHAVRIWSKPLTLSLLRDYPDWLQWNQQLRKAITGKEETAVCTWTCTPDSCKTQWKCEKAFQRA